jgi:hypothetical protein
VGCGLRVFVGVNTTIRHTSALDLCDEVHSLVLAKVKFVKDYANGNKQLPNSAYMETSVSCHIIDVINQG